MNLLLDSIDGELDIKLLLGLLHKNVSNANTSDSKGEDREHSHQNDDCCLVPLNLLRDGDNLGLRRRVNEYGFSSDN